MDADLPELPPHAFRKADESDDDVFYAPPRLVTHVDDRAIKVLTNFHRDVLPVGGRLLDLMSSWVSHLPPEVTYAEVVGHGMNAEELAANPRLDRFFVQNLNKNPALPLDDAAFDAGMITVSVQYLQRPVAVLRDLARVLRTGAPVVVSFSNRCFPSKAVAIWSALDTRGHAALVELYLRRAGFEDVQSCVLTGDPLGDPLVAVTGSAPRRYSAASSIGRRITAGGST